MSSSSAIRAGRAVVEIGTDQSLFDKGLAAVKSKMQDLTGVAGTISKNIGGAMGAAGDGLERFGRASMGVGAAMAGIGAAGMTAMGALTHRFADAGGAIDDMAQRTGLSAESIGRLAYVAKMSGTSIESVEKSVLKVGKSLSDARNGNQAAAATFARLGLSVSRLSSLSPEKQFATIADAVKNIRDPGQRAAMAMQLFGESGAALVPLLSQGSKGIASMMAEADALGVVMSGKDVAAAAELGDKLDQFWMVAESVANGIGASLAPVLIELADTMMSGLAIVRQFIRDFAPFAPMALQIAAGVAVAGAAIVAIGATMVGLGAAITGTMTVAATLGAVLAATFGAILSPIGLVVGGVVAFGGALLYYTGAGSAALNALQAAFAKFSSWVAPVIEGVRNALMNGQWSEAGQILMTALEIAFREGVGRLYTIWTDLQVAVLNAWTDLPVGILNGFDSMVSGLTNIWTSIVTNLQNAFSTVITWATGAWDETVNTIAKKLLYLYSLIDRSVDYEAAAAGLDKEANQRAAQRQKDLDAVTGGRNAANEKAQQERLAASQGRNAERTAAATATKNQRLETASANKDAYQSKTDGLQTKLNSLVDAVKTPNTEGGSTMGVLGLLKSTPIGGLLSNLGTMAVQAYENLPSLAETQSENPVMSGGTAGAFSGFAVGMMGNASPIAGLVDTSKKQLATLNRIEENTANPNPNQQTYV